MAHTMAEDTQKKTDFLLSLAKASINISPQLSGYYLHRFSEIAGDEYPLCSCSSPILPTQNTTVRVVHPKSKKGCSLPTNCTGRGVKNYVSLHCLNCGASTFQIGATKTKGQEKRKRNEPQPYSESRLVTSQSKKAKFSSGPANKRQDQKPKSITVLSHLMRKQEREKQKRQKEMNFLDIFGTQK
eukprot:TRINITY_DN2938_c0_g1_i1.p1 TRINITY_DN2938_c0_g1~~TRINITY_DN2938_c0_g1_i1.p1  ORF type:complete len:185 (+),score=27.70 TRINITY_DN2938_c0_g1_i1:69-623(+)